MGTHYPWQKSTISDAVTTIMDFRGRTPKKLGLDWGGGDIPAISARNVRMGSIDFRQEFYSASDHLYGRWMTQGDMRRGDTLITTEAPLGNVAAVPDDRRYILSQRVVLLRPRPDLFDASFFTQALQAPEFQAQLAANSSGSTALGIKRKTLERLRIPVPSLEEQRCIARAVRDADLQISVIEDLVSKKLAIKHGMMQQLLTGRTRLPGFTSPWHEVTMEEMAIVDPESLPASTSPQLQIDYISLEDVHRGELVGSKEWAFHAAPSRARRIVRPGDILFGTVRPGLKSHLHYLGGLPCPIASTGFSVIRARQGADPAFLFNLIMSDVTSVQVDRIIAGSNYPAVSSHDVRRLTFLGPGVDEQRAIALALSDARREVHLLRSRLEKARAIKTGMMQQLLTGRTRLPVEASA